MLYLDTERTSDYNKLREAELFLSQHREYCVVIDEVQRMPELFPLLRSLVDDDRMTATGEVPGRFLLLGSAAPDVMRQASESLAGRIAYMELTPFQRAEIRDNTPLSQHWLRGGFPKSTLAPDDDTSILWREMFITSYLERDLAQLGFSFTPPLMRRLWTMLAHYHGTPLNASASALSSEYQKAIGKNTENLSA
jgi:predicted AAA+ superfamily ATPase